MTPQEKAQLDYAVKRYKAAEEYAKHLHACFTGKIDAYNLDESYQRWQSLVNSEPTISEMETVAEMETVEDEKCTHEYRSFVDRVTKGKSIWCYKCGKEYPGAYSREI